MSVITNEGAARDMSYHADEAVLLAQTDPELQMLCVKFQMEHAAAKATFAQAKEEGVDSLNDRRLRDELVSDHLDATLRRMVDLTVGIGQTLLQRAVDYVARPQSGDPMGSPLSSSSQHSAADGHFPMRAASSSVEDLSPTGLAGAADAYWERAATLMLHISRVAALSFLVGESARPRLQRHALDVGLLSLCSRCLRLPRSVELRCFAEGFKTEVMNVLSNFTFGCVEACEAVGADEPLLCSILAATRVDEENPGMVEWAEFAIRNVCGLSEEARRTIQAQKPQSDKFMDEGADDGAAVMPSFQ